MDKKDVSILGLIWNSDIASTFCEKMFDFGYRKITLLENGFDLLQEYQSNPRDYHVIIADNTKTLEGLKGLGCNIPCILFPRLNSFDEIELHKLGVEVITQDRPRTWELLEAAIDAGVWGPPNKNAVSILYAEDDDRFARTFFEMMQALGYKPEQITRVSSAYALLDEHKANPDKYTLIISDTQMPDKNELTGLGALGIMRRAEVDIPFILLSGDDTIGEEVRELKGILISKGEQNTWEQIDQTILSLLRSQHKAQPDKRPGQHKSPLIL